jgi:hypothetical protein
LVYMRARYYDPATEQFISRDPLAGMSGQPYVYAGANPVNAVDPTGSFWDYVADAASIGLDVKDIHDEGLNWGNGLTLAADVLLGVAPFVPSFVGWAKRGGKAALEGINHADDVATLYRVEGVGNERFLIDTLGNVTLHGEGMLFVSFDSRHAAYFLQKRLNAGYNDVIKAFEIDASFLQTLRANRVPQRGARLFPGRPQWVDRSVCAECYGIPSNYFDQLQRSIIQGTGRTYRP